jgi:hypothetical protein
LIGAGAAACCAGDDGELLGSFSSKAEAGAELLLHTERGAFAQ